MLIYKYCCVQRGGPGQGHTVRPDSRRLTVNRNRIAVAGLFVIASLAEIFLLLPSFLLVVFAPNGVELSLLLGSLCILASGVGLLTLHLLLFPFCFSEVGLGLGIHILVRVIVRVSDGLRSRLRCAGEILGLCFGSLLLSQHGSFELSPGPLLGLLLRQFQVDLIIASLDRN